MPAQTGDPTNLNIFVIYIKKTSLKQSEFEIVLFMYCLCIFLEVQGCIQLSH